jgi:hypothetical protein
MTVMGVRRLSISLPAGVEESVRQAAEEAGLSVSAWLARAAERAARLEAGRRAISEFEAEHGPIPQEGLDWADRVLREHGVIGSETRAS